MPDHPTPTLAAAAEALLKAAERVEDFNSRSFPLIDPAALDTLRAALASDAAWRARAEAAVAVMEAEAAEWGAHTAWSAADDIQSAIEGGTYRGTLPAGMTHAEFDEHVAALDAQEDSDIHILGVFACEQECLLSRARGLGVDRRPDLPAQRGHRRGARARRCRFPAATAARGARPAQAAGPFSVPELRRSAARWSARG
mgnify:CR=1 FL=1